jgi:Inner membrane protein YgaP-like, transmembrane domain
MASKLLTRNMGVADRGFRAFVVAPAAIVAAVLIGASTAPAIVLFVVVGIALVTGVAGRCPSYVPFGIDTHGLDSRSRKLLPH